MAAQNCYQLKFYSSFNAVLTFKFSEKPKAYSSFR